MRKTFRLLGIFVLLLSTVTLMSSCKKDVSNLPGRWHVTAATIDNDDEDDLKDVWTFNTNGTCTIECDCDEYFDNVPYGIITFTGNYATQGNKKLTITSDRFHETSDGYNTVIYDLKILLLSKKTMMVTGTVKLVQYEGSIVNTKQANIDLTLSK